MPNFHATGRSRWLSPKGAGYSTRLQNSCRQAIGSASAGEPACVRGTQGIPSFVLGIITNSSKFVWKSGEKPRARGVIIARRRRLSRVYREFASRPLSLEWLDWRMGYLSQRSPPTRRCFAPGWPRWVTRPLDSRLLRHLPLFRLSPASLLLNLLVLAPIQLGARPLD